MSASRVRAFRLALPPIFRVAVVLSISKGSVTSSSPLSTLATPVISLNS